MSKEFVPTENATSWFPTLLNIVGGILKGTAERHDCRCLVAGKLCDISVYGMGRSRSARFARIDVKLPKTGKDA